MEENLEQIRNGTIPELSFRAALISDQDILRNIAYNSEEHWGYNNEFMCIFDNNYNT